MRRARVRADAGGTLSGDKRASGPLWDCRAARAASGQIPSGLNLRIAPTFIRSNLF
jgi:hypothetical protein